VLANENKTFKEQVKTLLEKGKHDDELIEALMKKQAQLKDVVESLSKQNEASSKDMEEKTVEAQIKSMQEKNTIEQLKLIVNERERRVKQLEEEVKRLRETNNNSNQQINSERFFLAGQPPEVTMVINKPNDVNDSEFLKSRPVSSSRKAAGSSLSRADSVNLLEREISSSRHAIRSGKPQSGGNQRPASSLNAKAIEQKKEASVDFKLENCELKTLYKTSEIERLRLLELVKSLQKRIEDFNERSLENENKLNEERRRSVNLEKQMEKLKLADNNNNKAGNSGGK
jgi:hypothetical protein